MTAIDPLVAAHNSALRETLIAMDRAFYLLREMAEDMGVPDSVVDALLTDQRAAGTTWVFMVERLAAARTAARAVHTARLKEN